MANERHAQIINKEQATVAGTHWDRKIKLYL